jgi:hypothetical protein
VGIFPTLFGFTPLIDLSFYIDEYCLFTDLSIVIYLHLYSCT